MPRPDPFRQGRSKRNARPTFQRELSESSSSRRSYAASSETPETIQNYASRPSDLRHCVFASSSPSNRHAPRMPPKRTRSTQGQNEYHLPTRPAPYSPCVPQSTRQGNGSSSGLRKGHCAAHPERRRRGRARAQNCSRRKGRAPDEIGRKIGAINQLNVDIGSALLFQSWPKHLTRLQEQCPPHIAHFS